MIIKGKEYNKYQAFEKFIEDFIDLIGELGEVSYDKRLVRSYSSLCQDPENDPSEDLAIFEADLYQKGWDVKELTELFENQADNIINRLESYSRGVGDYFLYRWTNKEFPLAGYNFEKESEDIMVKYSYGWQRHKYGILFLEQNGYDQSSFLELVAESFYDSRISDHIFCLIDFDIERGKTIKYKNKFKKFAIVEGNILEIHYKKIVEILNVMNFVEGDSIHEDLVDEVEFKDFIITTLNEYEYASYEEKPGVILCRFDP